MNNPAKTRTKDLQAGSILAEDVRDRSGRLLLPAGLAVREKHLRTLMAWGVPEVVIFVTGTPLPPGNAEEHPQPELDPETIAKAESIISDIFRHTDPAHPFTRELRPIATRRLAGDLAEDGRR